MHGKPWWAYVDSTVILPDGTVLEGGGLPLPSEKVAMNPSSRFNILSKISIRPTRQTQLEYSYLIDNSRAKGFSLGYRLNPDGVASNQRRNRNHSLHYTHTLSERAFLHCKTLARPGWL